MKSETKQSFFLAHSKNKNGELHALADHLRGVADRAACFAEAFGCEQLARTAGLLHDLGKYSRIFQARLRGKASGVDHWSSGVWAALRDYGPQSGHAAALLALTAAGHHLGLPQWSATVLAELEPHLHNDEQQRQRPGEPLDELLTRLRADGLDLPDDLTGCGLASDYYQRQAANMLDVRMLFSAVVDADFVDTEAHFEALPGGAGPREPGPALDPAWALDIVREHIARVAQGSTSDARINRLRADLLRQCLDAAARPTGAYTLTAPTGAGKTLAMLAFALAHAKAHGLRRVVMVIPYLTIIDQTARVFRQVFEPHLRERGVEPSHYVLEHHSLAGVREGRGGEEQDSEDPAHRQRRLLAQNWDAPIVVTTSVQMLESLFAHRPAACRKLHRLARSVILFDEVQTLPQHLAPATLAALDHLARRFGSSVVFSTATQPAFGELNKRVKKLGNPWSPQEIVTDAPRMFADLRAARRLRVHWPRPGQTTSWEDLAGQLAGHRQALCVVNLKRHAQGLLKLLRESLPPGELDSLVHLSTSMCPAHREDALAKVDARLQAGQPVRLVSTQCIEAGVDLDMPVVYRAWGPLEAIAQAAGRCNRNGLGQGEVYVFMPEDDGKGLYPPGGYQQATLAAQSIVHEYRDLHDVNINDPALYRYYYKELYDLDDDDDDELTTAIQIYDFPQVAELYQLIDTEAVNVVVPYAGRPESAALFQELAQEARVKGLSRGWIARARPLTVSVFPHNQREMDSDLEPVPMFGRNGIREQTGWYFLRADSASKDDSTSNYDSALHGLITGRGSGGLIV